MRTWYLNVEIISSILEFRWKLAWKLINNIYIGGAVVGG